MSELRDKIDELLDDTIGAINRADQILKLVSEALPGEYHDDGENYPYTAGYEDGYNLAIDDMKSILGEDK